MRTAPASVSPAHVEIPVSPEELQIPAPPCTYKLCGRVTCGPIDALMATGETLAGISAIALGAAGNYLSCGLMGGASVICMISHAAYRKWGNLAAIVERFNRAQESFRAALASQSAEVGRLGGEVGRITQLNAQYQKESEDFAVQNEALRKTVEEVSQSLVSLQHINEALKGTNAQLLERIHGLEATNQEIKTRIHEFAKQNGLFKDEIQKAAALIPKLDSVDDDIDHSVARLDREIDQDIDDLGRQLAFTQHLVKQLVELFQKGKEDFQSRIDAFNEEESDLERALQQVEAQRKQFVELQESYQKLSVELAHLRASQAMVS